MLKLPMYFLEWIKKYQWKFITVLLMSMVGFLFLNIHSHQQHKKKAAFTAAIFQIKNNPGTTDDLLLKFNNMEKLITDRYSRYYFLLFKYTTLSQGNDPKARAEIQRTRKEIKNIDYISSPMQYTQEVLGKNFTSFSMCGQTLLYYKCLFHFEDGELEECEKMHYSKCMDGIRDISYITLRAKILKKLFGREAMCQMLIKELKYGQCSAEGRVVLRSMLLSTIK